MLNDWVNWWQTQSYGIKLQFLNRNKVKYDYYNNKLEQDEVFVEEEGPNPEIPYEIPITDL